MLCASCKGRGTEVFLVSGGFRLMIDPLAEALRLGSNKGDGSTHKARQSGAPNDSPAAPAAAAASAISDPLAAATTGRSGGSSGSGAFVFANTVFFDERGEYAGFDASEFTASDGGKRRALAHLRASRPGLRSAMAAESACTRRLLAVG